MVLVIRNAQMQALARPQLEAFTRRMVDHVRRVFSERAAPMTDEQIRSQVQDGIERAEAYGIRREADVALFIDILFGIGPDFDDRPECAWIRTILENRDDSGTLRMQLVYDELPRRAR